MYNLRVGRLQYNDTKSCHNSSITGDGGAGIFSQNIRRFLYRGAPPKTAFEFCRQVLFVFVPPALFSHEANRWEKMNMQIVHLRIVTINHEANRRGQTIQSLKLEDTFGEVEQSVMIQCIFLKEPCTALAENNNYRW